jgi:hypothetical protein
VFSESSGQPLVKPVNKSSWTILIALHLLISASVLGFNLSLKDINSTIWHMVTGLHLGRITDRRLLCFYCDEYNATTMTQASVPAVQSTILKLMFKLILKDNRYARLWRPSWIKHGNFVHGTTEYILYPHPGECVLSVPSVNADSNKLCMHCVSFLYT